MGEICQVVVDGLRGEKTTIDLCNSEEQMENMTVKNLKEKIAGKLPDPADKFTLIFTDKMLDDDSLLSECGIQHLSVVLVVVSVEGWRDGGMGTKWGNSSSMEELCDF